MSNKTYNNRMAIIIPACDAYLDIFAEYVRYFKKNWSDCPFELILVSETKHFDDERVTSLIAGNEVNWTGRVLLGVNHCDCPYIMTMMEDQFISATVNTDDILAAIDFMEKHHIQYYRNPKHGHKQTKNNKFEDYEYACKLEKSGTYSRTLGIDIWERNSLIELFGDGMKSAWDIEKRFLEYSKEGHKGYFDTWVSDKRNFLHIIETVSGGKWMVDAIKRFEELGDPVHLGTRQMHEMSDYRRRKLHSIMNRIVPTKLRKPVKKIATKFGFKFATEE